MASTNIRNIPTAKEGEIFKAVWDFGGQLVRYELKVNHMNLSAEPGGKVILKFLDIKPFNGF